MDQFVLLNCLILNFLKLPNCCELCHLFILIITTFLYIYYFTCLCISIEQQMFLLNRASVVISFSSFDNSMYLWSTRIMHPFCEFLSMMSNLIMTLGTNNRHENLTCVLLNIEIRKVRKRPNKCSRLKMTKDYNN